MKKGIIKYKIAMMFLKKNKNCTNKRMEEKT